MAKARPIELVFLGEDHGDGPVIDKRTRGEIWELFRDGDKWVLVAHKGKEVLALGSDEVFKAISFPSFWLSTKHVGIRGRGPTYCFTPERESLAKLRKLVSKSEERNADVAAAHYRTTGWTGVGVGAALVVGIPVVVGVVSATGGMDDLLGYRGIVGLMIIGFCFGVYSLITGVRRLIRAGRFTSIAESESRRKRDRDDRD